jgi:hypothetical protein
MSNARNATATSTPETEDDPVGMLSEFLYPEQCRQIDLTPNRLARYLSGLDGSQNPPRLQRWTDKGRFPGPNSPGYNLFCASRLPPRPISIITLRPAFKSDGPLAKFYQAFRLHHWSTIVREIDKASAVAKAMAETSDESACKDKDKDDGEHKCASDPQPATRNL